MSQITITDARYIKQTRDQLQAELAQRDALLDAIQAALTDMSITGEQRAERVFGLLRDAGLIPDIADRSV